MLSYQECMQNFPFPRPRPIQEKAIQDIVDEINSGKKVILLDAPTGIGKSAINLAACRAAGRYYYMSPYNHLLKQLIHDFSGTISGIAVLKGRKHYNCPGHFGYREERNTCKVEWVKGNKGMKKEIRDVEHVYKSSSIEGMEKCWYAQEKQKAINSLGVLTNFHYFIGEGMIQPRNHGLLLQMKRDALALDECHNMVELVKDFNSIAIRESIFKLDLDWPMENTIRQECKEKILEMKEEIVGRESNIDYRMKILLPFIVSCFIPNLHELLDFLNPIVEEAKEKKETNKYVRRYRAATSLLKKMKRLLGNPEPKEGYVVNHPREWMKRKGFSIKVSPISVVEDIRKYFFDRAKKFSILSSATILSRDFFSEITGLREDGVAYLSYGMPFKIRNRPIHPLAESPNMTVNGVKNAGGDEVVFRKVGQQLNAILDAYPEDRGIVHTVSVARMEQIIEHFPETQNKKRLIQYTTKEKKKFRDFTKSSNGVLVSPSIKEGYDFKGSLARFLVITKVPYLPLVDSWINRFNRKHPKYRDFSMARIIVQMYGRGVRNKDDYCTTYVTDGSFRSVVRNAFLPLWFLEAIQTISEREIDTHHRRSPVFQNGISERRPQYGS